MNPCMTVCLTSDVFKKAHKNSAFLYLLHCICKTCVEKITAISCISLKALILTLMGTYSGFY